MPRGHARSRSLTLILAFTLTSAVFLPAMADAAWNTPVGGAVGGASDALGRLASLGSVTTHRFVGREFPRGPALVSTRGSGPDPDTNLTATGVASEERDAVGCPSPTLNQVAFASTGVDLDEDGLIDPTLPTTSGFEVNFNIWTMRSDGAQQRLITYTPGDTTVGQPGDQIEPAWHPGSGVLAFAGNQSGRWEVYTVEVRSGVISCLTAEQQGNKRHPTWSPDGNWIAYACDAAGAWNIYKLPASGGALHTQLTTGGEQTEPVWVPRGNALSPGGLAIAYTSRVGAVTRIEWVDASSQAVDALSDGGGDGLASDRDPAWSLDAMGLAFASNRFSDSDLVRNYNVWRMGPLGEISSSAAALVSNADPAATTDSLDPSWSAPADRQPLRFYYESNRVGAATGAWSIWRTQFRDTTPPYLLDLPTMDARQLAPGDDAVFHVRPYDADSGVSAIQVRIKDPDQKIYVVTSWMPQAQWDSGFDGEQYLEWDYRQVGNATLYDDGDPGNGDAVAGDGVFSGVWTTPNAASDFVIDVAAVDLSGNSQVYDSVYGFSTEVFSPAGTNVLLVNDYCEGQHFLYETGFNNDFGSAWYTESFYSTNPGYSPNAANQSAAATDPRKDTIRAYAYAWGVDEPYKIWRVISRGPVPPSVYQYYLPTVQYQLDPAEALAKPAAAKATRVLPVAERAILWASPHTGDVWVADGSLVDAGTQADLGLFLDRGGRLTVSGSDIAWALTLAGTVPNTFLSNYLRASYVRDVNSPDSYAYNGIGYGPNWSRSQLVDWGWNLAGRAGDPVAFDPWESTNPVYTHWSILADGVYDSTEMPTALTTPDITNGSNASHADASEYSWRPDVIQEVGGDTVKLYVYDSNSNGAQDAGEPTAGIRYENAVSGARAMYLAFGLESVHRGYHSPGGSIPPHCMNHRATLVHNALCWMRTGSFQGRVVDTAGGKPITGPNPIVRFYRGIHAVGSAGVPDYAVRCQDDGTYMVAGIKPGFYSIEAFRLGYDIDHFDGYMCHGGWAPFDVDFAVSKSRPGVVAGTVTSKATGAFLPLVEVKAWAVPPPPPTTTSSSVEPAQGTTEPDWAALGDPLGTAVTAVDGTYKLVDLPPGDYYVRADGTTTGYGTAWAEVKVTTGNTTTQDFKLAAADGNLIAMVTDLATTDPVANALVQVRSATGTVVASGKTAADGVAEIGLQPGTYQVSASAAGYEASASQPATIVSSEDKHLTFALATQPPGSLTGKIVSASSAAPVGGVLVRLIANDVIVATTVSAATFTTPGDAGPTYNYSFADVPTGPVDVVPVPVGFTASPAQRTVTVTSGLVTPSVNFTLTSLHTFPSGLQLVSTPYDYSDVDPAILLGASDGLMMATWEASTQRYRSYPMAPADRFRVGTGYWLRLSGLTDVTRQGADAVDPTPVLLEEGWNLVGDPFPVLVDFFSARVEDRTGTMHSMQQALAAGLVEGGMFAYVMGGYQNTAVFSPWVGTWLNATQPLTMYVSRTSGALGAGRAAAPAVTVPEGGWLASIEASVGDSLKDTATHFGVARSATAGYDKGLDVSKPPIADFAPTVYCAFANDDWGARKGYYSTDIRPAAQSAAVWPLEVRTNQAGADVTLRWPDLSSAPNTVKPLLRDCKTGQTTYMRTTAGYTFRSDGSPRRFEISLREIGSGVLAVTAVAAREAAGGCAISYSISCDATVGIEVLTIGGRRVGAVSAGLSLPAGAHTATWDGRNSAGSRVPSGRYLVKLTARTADGQETHSVAAVSLTRR